MLMLFNGGVLGLVHRDLPPDLRPSADSWRIATLLLACGSLLLIVQSHYRPGFILTVANALLMLGLTGYWRALRQFNGQPDRWLMLLPTALASFGIFWFAEVAPDLGSRVLVATVVWLALIAGALHALWGTAIRAGSPISHRVMVALFVLVGLFMLSRLGWFLLASEPGATIIDPRSWVNMVTPLMATVLPVIGTTVFLLMCSERIRRRWEEAASTDYLTGLANRRTLMQLGAQRLERARRKGQPLAVAVIDIDHFKQINDRHGHEVGDQALRHVAEVLGAACRDSDVAARQGGEEFVALFDALEAADVAQLAERLRTAVEAQAFVSAGTAIPLSVSIGVTALQPGDRHLDDLLQRADRALYAAKDAGRNRVFGA